MEQGLTTKAESKSSKEDEGSDIEITKICSGKRKREEEDEEEGEGEKERERERKQEKTAKKKGKTETTASHSTLKVCSVDRVIFT